MDQEVASEAELDRRARIDALTGLLNRTEIFERLDVLKQADRRHSGDVGILFCDIDHFKAINDTHGHAGGDAVLQILATRIQHSIRSNDLVARLGGDELMVVLTGISNLTEVESIAEKIHQSVQQPLDLPTGKVVPTLSIGVTLIGHDEPIDAVVARADAAMYEAKQHGRNRVVTFG